MGVRKVVDLRMAGEPVREHDSAGWARGRRAERRKQALLRDGTRDLVVAAFDSEVPGHPAAAREPLHARAGRLQEAMV